MRDQVAAVIEVIRPAIQADGGDIDLIDVDESSGVVTVELTGACVSCPASTVTMKAGIERIIAETPVPVVPTYASFSVDRIDVQAGESVTITVKMSAPVDSVRVHAEGDDGTEAWHDAGLYLRENLQPGATIAA